LIQIISKLAPDGLRFAARKELSEISQRAVKNHSDWIVLYVDRLRSAAM
jgi:hypothetical protein